jgi:hypothetical protein
MRPKKDKSEVTGASLLLKVLSGSLDDAAASKVVNNITRVWGRHRNPVFSSLPDSIRQELERHVLETICYSPPSFVVAHSHKKQILYAKVEEKAENLRVQYTTVLRCQVNAVCD